MPAVTRRDYDAAVVGGGLLGAAIAWGLARAGQRVAVLDEGDVALRASRGNFALVWVQSKGLGMPEYAAWTVGLGGALLTRFGRRGPLPAVVPPVPGPSSDPFSGDTAVL